MKQVIFLMLFMALFLGCHESNSVEPVLDNSAQLNHANGTLDLPIKSGDNKKSIFSSSYNFNPENQCGGFLNGTSLEYIINDETKGELVQRNGSLEYVVDDKIKGELVQRYILNAQVYSPSKMVIDRKPFKTCNIYTINRMEKATQGGKVLSGKTWGTFKIVVSTGSVPDENSVVLFEGEFSGDILFNATKIYLKGKGQKGYKDRYLTATEEQVCSSTDGALRCWQANMKGLLSQHITPDD